MSACNKNQLDIWYKAYNITLEKTELYYDFLISLLDIIEETYLGNDVLLSQQDIQNHFTWCFDKLITNFQKENINFETRGEHYDYFLNLFMEIYYGQNKETIRNSIDVFFNDLFNREKPFTQVDLDLIFNIYKSLDKNLII